MKILTLSSPLYMALFLFCLYLVSVIPLNGIFLSGEDVGEETSVSGLFTINKAVFKHG